MTIQKIKVNRMLNTAKDGFAVLVEHESTALGNQLSGVRERIAVARRARNLGELLRHQIDLLPDTGARLRRDHALRGDLLRGLQRDLARGLGFGKAA